MSNLIPMKININKKIEPISDKLVKLKKSRRQIFMVSGMLSLIISPLSFATSISIGLPNYKIINNQHIPDVVLHFNNDLFLYGDNAEEFDLVGYLENNSPVLLNYHETIAHWSGYYSINPKIALALMEIKSGIISNPDTNKLTSLFGDLSNKVTVSEQLQDVLFRLSWFFYQYEKKQLRNNPEIAEQQRIKSLGVKEAATVALSALQASGQSSLERQNTSQFYSAFTDTFSALFTDKHEDTFSSRININHLNSNEMLMVPPTSMMQFPWRIGYSWKSNGAHSHTGSGYPFSSIDVSYDWPRWGGNTYSVVAAHNGTVNVLSRCQVRVTNPNGWATNYYHMDGIQVQQGQWVNADTKLGTYASNKSTALCEGGSSTGPHLHFSLLKNGRYVSLQGVNFGEYQVNIGRYNYDGNCSRFYFSNLSNNGYKCAWSSIYNNGVRQ